jgi:hypothetical protein
LDSTGKVGVRKLYALGDDSSVTLSDTEINKLLSKIATSDTKITATKPWASVEEFVELRKEALSNKL